MAGPRATVLGISTILLAAASAPAFYECLTPYCPPRPMIAVPFVPCPCPVERSVPLACPTPAPASHGPDVLSTHEPPLANKPGKGPVIYQNRTFSGVPQTTEPRTATCKVSFWNLSGLDVVLSVGERAQPIAKDRAVILDLDRRFTWRTNFHNPKSEEVADDLNHFEVMIR